MPTKAIVLVHGFLGFSGVPLTSINYFNGIKNLYEDAGYTVLVPDLSAVGSIAIRSLRLKTFLQNNLDKYEQFCVIAHSMGGLDMRSVLAENQAIRAKTKCLITIATPLFGSPVATAITGDLSVFPRALRKAIKALIPAFIDLEVRKKVRDVNCGDVEYVEIACKIPKRIRASKLFAALRLIGHLTDPNDGVVPYHSAFQGEAPTEVWEVDHGEAIGWPSHVLGLTTVTAAFNPPSGHLERYLGLIQYF
jgi:triacylglycerol lipase